jgi:hypothetical protein
MKRNIFYLSVVMLFGCRQEQASNEEVLTFTHKDEQVYSFTDIDNPLQGFSQDDQESLNKTFSSFIFQAFNRGDVQFFNLDDQEISKTEAKKLLTETRSIKVSDPESPEQSSIETKEHQIKVNEIVQLVSRENWFFNESDFSFSKRITHIGPVVYVYDTDGDVRGKRILFWIKINSN